MAKIPPPITPGEMMKVELDPRGSASVAWWCGKHAPEGPGICVHHGRRLYELHDEDILNKFGVEAIFYCPRLGCDHLAWDVRTSHLIAACTDCLYRNLDPYSNMRTVVFELFRSAALFRILFLKQRQMADKLGFIYGKKI